MKLHYKPLPGHFVCAFVLIVIALAVAKCIRPASELLPDPEPQAPQIAATQPLDSIDLHAQKVDSILLAPLPKLHLLDAEGNPVKNRVTSVQAFETSFPDLNDIQLETAQHIGVEEIKNRQEAARQIDKLVYIGDNPFYEVEPLNYSIPYLVPRAATLLSRIARAFNDSLFTKGYPPHKLIVTSVTRTAEDVERLRRRNQNASEQSCHRFGTTFDIAYNKFREVKDPDQKGELARVTAYKSILAEVLEDQRLAGTCFVKYEFRQACFHVTAR